MSHCILINNYDTAQQMRRILNISYQCQTRNGNEAYPDGIVTCETNRSAKQILEVYFMVTFE